MDKWSACDNCDCAYIFHAQCGSGDRHDPQDSKYEACPLKSDLKKFSSTQTFQHKRSSMIPDCVPNGGIEIGDGYYKG